MTGPIGKRYTKEMKEAILKRMMPPNNESIKRISEDVGITETTLYMWRKEARIGGNATPGDGQGSEQWNSQDKFLVVIETYSMNEAQLAEYCRKKGLYKEQIEAWRDVCLKENGIESNQTKQLNQELKEEKKRAKTLEKDLQKKEKALAEAAALLLVKKKGPSDLGGPRGRMISLSDRALAVELIQETNQNGARLALACKELHISVRTYKHWVSEGGVKEDRRPIIVRPEPKNKLTKQEKNEMLKVVKREEFANLPPSQIVPKLADQNIYLASESSFYRVLREQNMQHHRGRSKKPERRLPETISQQPLIKYGRGILLG